MHLNDTRTKLHIHAHVHQTRSNRMYHCRITITSSTEEMPLSINRALQF